MTIPKSPYAAAPVLEGIGLVVVSWSALETAVEELVWILAGFNNFIPAHIITAEMKINQRLDAVLALAQGLVPHSSETYKRLVELNRSIRDDIGGVKSLQSKRNRVVHAFWGGMGDNEVAFTAHIKARRKLDFDIRPMRRDDLLAIASDISAATERARELAVELRESDMVWPDGARP